MKHITSEERHTIAYLRGQKKSPAYIARVLGRDRSTITREIKRNCDLRSKDYRSELANKKAVIRKCSKRKRCGMCPEIEAHVKTQLAKKT
jgi:IS30 family transposase